MDDLAVRKKFLENTGKKCGSPGKPGE